MLRIPSRVAVALRRPQPSVSRFPVVVLGPTGLHARLPSIAQQVSFATKSKSPTKTSNEGQVGIDPEEDKKAAQRKFKPQPERVSTQSSGRQVSEPDTSGRERPVNQGIAEELEAVKSTFSLHDVPKEPFYLGLAGTLPYLGTSVSTVYLSWVLNTPWPAPSAFANNIMIAQESASRLLTMLEPIQLGYGAVIISFLGAVHWGLEYAAKVPDETRTRFRYGIGVMAPIVAWPTLFMPVEFALMSQFAAFTALYFADARAAVRGWAPAWYSIYRFALTAVVGVAIAVSLIGRAKVGDARPQLTGLNEKFHQRRHGEEPYTEKWAHLEEEEKQKIKKEEAEAEEEKRKEEEAVKKEKGKGKNKNKDKSKNEDKDKKKDGEENKDKEKTKDDGKDKDEDNNQDKDQGESGSEGDDKQDDSKDKGEKS